MKSQVDREERNQYRLSVRSFLLLSLSTTSFSILSPKSLQVKLKKQLCRYSNEYGRSLAFLKAGKINDTFYRYGKHFSSRK